MVQSILPNDCRTQILNMFITCRESRAGKIIVEVSKVAAAAFSLHVLSRQLFSPRLLNLTLSSRTTVYGLLIISPIVEEILFTGTLQELLRTIQSIFYKKHRFSTLTSDSEMGRVFRVFVTGMGFSAVHVLLGDRSLIRFTFRLMNQMTRGIVKEKYQTLFTTILSHGVHNITLIASIAYPSARNLCYGIMVVNCLAMGILAIQ